MLFGRSRRRVYRARPSARELDLTVDETQTIGGIFVVVGAGLLVAIVAQAKHLDRAALLGIGAVSTLLIAPGVLYVLAGVFLRRRRYWAWVATRVMTIVLLWVVGLGGVAAVVLTTINQPLIYGLGPVVGFGCWGAALGIILSSLRRNVRLVREAEHVAQKGFHVLPVRRAEEE
jgi:hypothetical protein